jgi:hypothetical protein
VFKSWKSLVGLAAVFGVSDGLCFLWWGRLIVGTFAQCVGGAPTAGVDCAYNAQILAALALTAFTIVLVIAAAFRAVGSRRSTRRVA